jgi:hypothetical protein
LYIEWSRACKRYFLQFGNATKNVDMDLGCLILI